MSGINRNTRDQGYSLIAAMIFVLVVVIAGMAFFAMSSSETRIARYRQESTEAFYLADAAIERARAKFLEDRSWRSGWTDVDCGTGRYSLAVADTTYAGLNDCVQLIADGVSGHALRRIEVLAEVPPTSLALAVQISGSADVNGDICVLGNLQINGTNDFGPHDIHLKCGELSGNAAVTPPPIFTGPAHFPDATYYYVKGAESGGLHHARIFDASGNDITAAKGDSLTAVLSYDAGQQTFVYDFDSDALIARYFDQAAGVFSRNPGDMAVVVNFGEVPVVNPPGMSGISEVIIDGTSSVVTSTIINTRFTGVSSDQRYDTAFWTGGLTSVKQITMEPDYGIALIAADFMKNGGARVDIGTATTPAYIYITNDLQDANANFEIQGAVTVLGDWMSSGHLTITYDTGFLSQVPSYLFDTFPAGSSGTLRVLTWQEI